MAKAPAFQFYASDWLVGTMLMTPAQKGGYIDLLAYEWEHGDIPKDMIGKISGLNGRDLEAVTKKFILIDGDVYVNIKLEKTRAKQRKFSKEQSDKANKRWNGNAEQMPESYQDGNAFLEGEDRTLKTENSFEKSEKLLKNYDEWGQMILDGMDQGFEVEIYNSGIDISEVTQDRMILYLGLLNTYPKKRPATQQQFRKSFLAFIVEDKQQKKNGNKSSGNKTRQQSNSEHTANQLGRVLDGTL